MSPPPLGQFDRQIEQIERDVAQQEAHVRRLIIRGAPTQAAEDRLRHLQQELSRLKKRAGIEKP